MANLLYFEPSQIYQSASDVKSYVVAVSNWLSAPTGASVMIYENGTDRAASNLSSSASGGATVSGTNVTTPCFVGLRGDVDYQVYLRLEQGGEVLYGFFDLTGVD